jgi:hypothetical protein
MHREASPLFPYSSSENRRFCCVEILEKGFAGMYPEYAVAAWGCMAP